MSVGALIEKFRSVALDRVEKMNLTLVALERDPHNEESAKDLLREVHTLKGEAKMMGFADVNLVAHLTEHLLLEADQVGFDNTKEGLTDLVFAGLDILRSLLTKTAGQGGGPVDLAGFVDAVADARAGTKLKTGRTKPRETGEFVAAVPDSERLRIQSQATLRVDVDKLESLGDTASEVLLMARRLGYRLSEVEAIGEELKEWVRRNQHNLPKSQGIAARTISHQLDSLVTTTREDLYLAGVRSSQLDDETRRLRHVKLSGVLSHYPRAVRDLATSQGKDVRFVHEFGDVEVDRVVLAGLSDPLLHLIRNAVDHGIESPEDRKNAGKDEEGELRLIAEYSGDSIVVSLEDDGAGIDPDVLRQKAIDREFRTKEELDIMTDSEVVALIFESGFSTRDAVTDISGRGIGMDVVRRQVTQIGGTVDVESEVGVGTRFRLVIPVSSAISTTLMVKIAGRVYAIPAKDVERLDVIPRNEVVEIRGGYCVKDSGEMIPLVDWSDLLEIKPRQLSTEQISVMILRRSGSKAAVWVDEVIGEREAMNRPLGEFLSGIRACRGVALTDAGEVIPLINVSEVMVQTQMRNLGGTQRLRATMQTSAVRSIKTVLVTEDSEVTRSLVSGILRNSGYRVIEAEDGNDGWRKLEAHRVHLVLTDVQMPGMDGIEFLRRIRADQRYESTPVIVLTTLSSTEDRERAMKLGANGYLGKLDFRERDLIQAVERYLR